MKHKLVIWGYPLYSDTFSYVWYGFFKAAQFLSNDFDEVVWLDNKPDQNINLDGAIVLCEGWKDNHLPLHPNATYIVHCCRNTERYLGKCKRLIDLRYSCDYQDHKENYQYYMDRFRLQQIGPEAFYDKTGDYEKIYLPWATDLLPHEFDFDAIKTERTDNIYFIGSLYSDKYENKSTLDPFIRACKDYGINFIHIDPWRTPVSMEDNRKLIMKAYLAPDIRGPHNINIGYLPCRIYKNISYGQLGLTNSRAVYSSLNNLAIYHPNTYTLFELGQLYRNEYDRIEAQMKFVQNNHTYLNRIQSILNIL